MRPIAKYQEQSVVIPANSTQGRFYFPDLPNLRDVNTMKVEIYPASSVLVDINNIPNAQLLDYQQAYLTLVTNGEETVQNIPLIRLNAMSDNNAPFAYEVPELNLGRAINYSKSYITLPGNPASANQFAFIFGIYYQ